MESDELVERWERWLQNTGYDGGVNSPAMLVLQRMKDDADRIEVLTAQLAEARESERAAKRGEFICTKCYLRQDADFTPGDF